VTPTTPAANADLYATLGVEANASDDDITTAFRARAKDLHPDLHPGDVVIAERFKRLTGAYRVLSRPAARAAYDARRAAGAASAAAPAERAPAPTPASAPHDPVFRTPRRARAAIWSGIALVVLGLAASGVLLAVPTGGSAQTITLWIVAAKLVVCGALLWGTGAWRLHTLRTETPRTGALHTRPIPTRR
jgi:hypothetical protein